MNSGILLSMGSTCLILTSSTFFQFRSINEDAVALDLMPKYFYQNYRFMGLLMLIFCLLSFLSKHKPIKQLTTFVSILNFALIAFLIILTLQTEAVSDSIVYKLDTDSSLSICAHLAQQFGAETNPAANLITAPIGSVTPESCNQIRLVIQERFALLSAACLVLSILLTYNLKSHLT